MNWIPEGLSTEDKVRHVADCLDAISSIDVLEFKGVKHSDGTYDVITMTTPMVGAFNKSISHTAVGALIERLNERMNGLSDIFREEVLREMRGIK